jgi:hypothetical protein
LHAGKLHRSRGVFAPQVLKNHKDIGHCEERSDEAIQNLAAGSLAARLDCFALLAMTKKGSGTPKGA